MTPAQCRAARALIDWPQQALADAAGIGIVTVRQFEAGVGSPRNATLEALMNCLEASGIEFFAGNGAGPGVRLTQDSTSFAQFLAFVKLYERRRLLALGRHANPLPLFGYRFAYNQAGAELTFRGERLGEVRWEEGNITFAPPLPMGCEVTLSDEIFDKWVSIAEYHHTIRNGL